MTRRRLAIYVAAAALLVGPGPALAQERPAAGGGGARPNPSGESGGSAVSRPSGGGGGGSASSSGSGGGSSSGGSVSSPAPGGSSSSGGGDGYRAPRPERRPENRAVPRDSAAGSGESRRMSPAGASASSGDQSGDQRRAVPAYSRPRDGRTPIGTAVDRRGPVPNPDRDGGYGYYYDPYYRYSSYYSRYPYGYYSPGYGFGVGYFYDPWMWGYTSPYALYDPYYGGGGGYGYSRYRSGSYRPVGSLRLKVKPEKGQVYVDGYYVGEVDSFDGVFQRLNIEEGAHRVEIRAPGYEPVQFEVMVIPGETVTYKGDLKRIQ